MVGPAVEPLQETCTIRRCFQPMLPNLGLTLESCIAANVHTMVEQAEICRQ